MRDLVRYEVIPRKDGVLVAYGHKTLEATFAKIMRAGGYVSLESPQYIAPEEAIARMDQAIAYLNARIDFEVPEEKEERMADLQKIRSVLAETLRMKNSMLGSEHQKTLAKINAVLGKMRELEIRENETALECFSEDFEYKSSKSWPMEAGIAPAIVGILQKMEAKSAGAQGNGKKKRQARPCMPKEEFSEFLDSYRLELSRNVGTARLQPDSTMLISMFIKSLQIAMAKTAESELAEQKLNSTALMLPGLQKRIANIHQMIMRINGLLDDMEAGAISAGKSPSRMFQVICEIGETRKSLAYELANLKSESKPVAFDKFDRNSAAVILTTLEHNLLSTSKGEADLWRRFLEANGKGLSESLVGAYPRIKSGVEKFISQAEADASKKRCYGDTAPPRRAPKDEMALLETELYELMKGMRVHGVDADKVLLEIFFESKSHLLYKLGGTRTLCGNIGYYLNPERLLAASGRQEELSGLLQQNREMFSLFEKYMPRETVLDHLDKFNYTESNALDSDTDAEKLLRLKSKGDNVQVNYSVDTAPAAAGGGYERKATFTSKQYSGSLGLSSIKANASDNLLFDKHFDEVLFCKKEEISAFLHAIDPSGMRGPKGSVDLGRIYGTLSIPCTGKAEWFEAMRAKMKDANSDEYLLSFANKARVLNGAIFIPRKGEIRVNDPIRLGGKNDLAQALGIPQEEAEAKMRDIQEYLRLMPARLMFHEANSRKWEWALQCAEFIAVLS
ncbi:Uncharacterised protein [uncultured archaeon]|nr:Uncharacterised protein [uncultured archaeon]